MRELIKCHGGLHAIWLTGPRITERAESVVGHKVEFNEVLSVLYREGQKMSWHDDGEPGTSPVPHSSECTG